MALSPLGPKIAEVYLSNCSLLVIEHSIFTHWPSHLSPLSLWGDVRRTEGLLLLHLHFLSDVVRSFARWQVCWRCFVLKPVSVVRPDSVNAWGRQESANLWICKFIPAEAEGSRRRLIKSVVMKGRGNNPPPAQFRIFHSNSCHKAKYSFTANEFLYA